MSESTAEQFFATYRAYRLAEGSVMDALLRAVGADPDNIDAWPFADFTHDDYDGSVELVGCDPSWAPDLSGVWALGFDRAWLRYSDGTERHATPEHGLEESVPSAEYRRKRDEGVTTAVRSLTCRLAALTAENERLTREITNACDTAMRLDIPTRELVGRLRAALPSTRDTTDEAERS